MTMISRSVAAVVFALGMALSAGVAGAQTVDEIVELHYKSRGGEEAWKAIETQRMTATIYTQGIEIALVSTSKRPNLLHQQLDLEIPGTGPMQIVNVFDGSRAWMLNPMLGASTFQEATGPEGQGLRDQSEFDTPLFDYEARGYTIELVGRTDIDGRVAHHLRITRPDQPVVHYYIDAVTGSELRIESEGPMASTVSLSDHREQPGGVLMPHHIVVEQNGMQTEIVVSSVEFNVPVDDSLFKVQ